MASYHFTPKHGWLNDPNGLAYFKGQYHLCYQYCPSLPPVRDKWWGHAVSADLLTWEEIEPALKPDTPADENGIWSGSAIVHDGVMYAFYTGLRNEGEGTDAYIPGHGQFGICLATSEDGVHFEKHPANPLIPLYPPEGSPDFRDPSVSYCNGAFYLMLAASNGLLYRSEDLVHWEFVGVPLATGPIECPDFRPFADGYLYIFSQGHLDGVSANIKFAYGDFDGKTFTPRIAAGPELGPHFYSPQTLTDDKDRILLFAWMYCIEGSQLFGNGTPPVPDVNGQITIPHEITLRDGKICAYPPVEYHHLLVDSDPDLTVTDTTVTLNVPWKDPITYTADRIWDIKVFRESNMIEVFINRGEAVFTYCY